MRRSSGLHRPVETHFRLAFDVAWQLRKDTTKQWPSIHAAFCQLSMDTTRTMWYLVGHHVAVRDVSQDPGLSL
jgi:hypothetical protein